jgi:magnesium chelatase family protein
MPEFDRSVLEALRQPMEDGEVTVARAHSTISFPAQTILIAAMNPCPCGFRGLPAQRCVSNPATCIKYAGKISSPLMDRIDLHIDVPRLNPDELIGAGQGECSAAIRERVYAARVRQHERLGRNRVNAKMTPREIRETIPLDAECTQFMKVVSSRLNLSARVFDRVLKVARTIADLEGTALVGKTHLSEAVQYRERSGG